MKIIPVLLIMSMITCTTMAALHFINQAFFSDQPAEEKKIVNTPSPSAESEEVQQDGVRLKETKDAGRSYQDETLYLGDSNTVRFMNSEDEDGETFTNEKNTIAVVGMGAGAIDSLECEQLSTGTFTMVEAVSYLQPKRILVTFGTNNLGGTSTDAEAFISTYSSQLEELHESYPYADLIVNSIPPIAPYSIYTKVHIEQIAAWNEAIEKMCEEHKWKYLNSYEALIDQTNGYAKQGYMDTDGLHFSQEGMKVLFHYYRTHAWTHEETSPMPLQEIPEIIGPLTTLYKTNPLNNQTFTQDVLKPTFTPSSEETIPASTPVPTPVPSPSEPVGTTSSPETETAAPEASAPASEGSSSEQ